MGDQLVYSFDDYVGYGFHGDFFNGWKPGVVEALLDQCTYQTPVIYMYLIENGLSKLCFVNLVYYYQPLVKRHITDIGL